MRRSAPFLAALTTLLALAGPPDLQVFRASGHAWLLGCAEDDDAERLVAHAGFEYGYGTAPVAWLCVEGYSAITKQLH